MKVHNVVNPESDPDPRPLLIRDPIKDPVVFCSTTLATSSASTVAMLPPCPPS